MKIKLLVGMCGPDVCHKPGDVIEVSDAEAKRHFESGSAKPVTVEATPPAKPDQKKNK